MRAANISEVLDCLDEITADSSLSPTNRLFPALYRRVTFAIQQGIIAGKFDDGPRMDVLDTRFANRYLVALSRWRQGQAPSASWQVAFDAGAEGGGVLLQHVLLGMNAHINLDLGVAAASLANNGDISSLRRDFDRVNGILVRMIDDVEAIFDDVSPVLAGIDHISGHLDETIAGFSIRKARAAAWQVASHLAPLSLAERRLAISTLDSTVAALGRRVWEPGALVGAALWVVHRTESHDIESVIARLR